MKVNYMGMSEISAIVNMDYSEAKEHLDKYGYTIRITILDGRPKMVSGDIDMKRINVFVSNGVVVEIDKVG